MAPADVGKWHDCEMGLRRGRAFQGVTRDDLRARLRTMLHQGSAYALRHMRKSQEIGANTARVFEYEPILRGAKNAFGRLRRRWRLGFEVTDRHAALRPLVFREPVFQAPQTTRMCDSQRDVSIGVRVPAWRAVFRR